MARYTLTLNGQRTTVDSWDSAQPLLYVLRGSLNLTGSRFGCGIGQCGACTVLVDGAMSRACTTPIASVANRRVTTIEGLGTPERPDRVQAAFIAEQAAQCGYCTSGMIVATTALLSRTPKPTLDQIRQGLAGNLCRCGTHTRILRAVMRASQA